jgi:hypothetical protein
MRKVAVFSLLLIAGMVGAQLPFALAGEAYADVSHGLRLATMVALAFMMIHVGYEFELDKTNLRQYGWDYVVAMTAAAFPWVFVVLYFTVLERCKGLPGNVGIFSLPTTNPVQDVPNPVSWHSALRRLHG